MYRSICSNAGFFSANKPIGMLQDVEEQWR